MTIRPSADRWMRILSGAMTALLSAFLVYKLTRIGWANIWASMPTALPFYAVVIVKRLALPLSQAWAFQATWGRPFRRYFAPSLVKDILDKNVLGLSGDVYLFTWARRNVPAASREIVLSLKDHLLLSGASSVIRSALLLGVFLALDIIARPAGRLFSGWRDPALAVLAVLTVGWILFRFRKKVFFLEKRVLAKVFLIHFGRGLVVQALQVLQWALAMPEVSLTQWLNLVALQILVAFVPILPGRNLVFFGAGLEVSGRLEIDRPGLAATFLAATALVQVLNLALFIWASLAIKKAERAGAAVRRTDEEGPRASAGSGPPTGSAGPDTADPSG